MKWKEPPLAFTTRRSAVRTALVNFPPFYFFLFAENAWMPWTGGVKWRIRIYKSPRCVWKEWVCFFALLLYLDLSNSPQPPPSSVQFNTSGCLYNSLCCVFNESLSFEEGQAGLGMANYPPLHWQAVDDYRGMLTTGLGGCNLPADANGKCFFLLF